MYTPIIGLEIHLQLKTSSKVFCSCSTKEADPNTNICPICLGYPGAMPSLNKEAVKQAVRMGAALKCSIAHETNWDRKSYMYPDLFKGYQISQLDNPVCGTGTVEIVVRNRKNYYSKDNYSKKVGIIRAHLEEDTAKSTHSSEKTVLDANKAGVPLLEVVSAPEMHTVDEAVSYAKTIRNLARWYSVCEGNLELGQMRFDANISIQVSGENVQGKTFEEWGEIEFTPIVEIKNLNSFGNLQDALDYEINRQIEVFEQTGEKYSKGAKETRGWDADAQKTYTQRKKEEANEYRFIPEPDIPTLVLSASDITEITSGMNAHPSDIKAGLVSRGVAEQAATVLSDDITLYNAFAFLKNGNEDIESKVANLVTNELASELSLENISLSGLHEVMVALKDNKINSNQLKTLFAEHMSGLDDWKELLASQLNSENTLDIKSVIQKAFTDNPGVVDQIKSGKDSAKMFFVGIVMRETKGKANINEIKQCIDELLAV